MNKKFTYAVVSASVALMIGLAAFLFVRTEKQLDQITLSSTWHQQFHDVFDGSQVVDKRAREIELSLFQYIHYHSEGSFQQLSTQVSSLREEVRKFNSSTAPDLTLDKNTKKESQLLLLSEQLLQELVTIQPSVLPNKEEDRIESVQKTPFYTHLIEFQRTINRYILDKEQQDHLTTEANNAHMRENSHHLRWLTSVLVIFLLAGWFSIVILLKYGHDKEKTLQQQEQTLSAYFNSVIEGILVVDAQWVIRDFNQALEKMILHSGGKLPTRAERLDQYLAADQLVPIRACLENAARGVQTSEEIRLNFGGKPVWIMMLCTPVLNPNKELSHIIISMDDLDILIQTRSQLAEQETKFQSVISSLTSGVIIVNQHLQMSYINPAGEKLLQIKLNELQQGKLDHLQELSVWSEDGEQILIDESIITNWEFYTNEQGNRIIGYQRSSSYSKKWLLGNLCKLPRRQEGSLEEFLFSFSDYTHTKNAADELRETEQLLHATFQSSPVPIVITSLADGILRNVNDHFVQLTQYTSEDLVGKDVSYRQQIGLIDPVKRQAMLDRLKENQFIQGYEMQIKRKDGKVIDVLVSACIITINQEAFLFSYLFDYTERKRMENELRFSEEKFYSIFHHSPVALAVSNSTGELIDVNETLLTLSGFKREDFIGNTTQSLGVYFDYHDRDQFLQDVKEQGFSSYREVKLRDNFGQMRVVLMSARAIIINGEACLLSFILDLSELKQVESELKRNEQNYRSLASNVPGVVFRFHVPQDKPFYFSFISEKLESMYGFKLALDANIEDVATHVPAEEQDAFRKSLTDAIQAKQPWVFDGRILCGDGTTRWVAGRATPSLYDDDLVYSGLLIDIHDLKMAEANLVSLNKSLEQKADELESSNQELERFAYIASHDLQEPLRMVSGFVRLLEKRYSNQLDDAAREFIHYAVDGADRMKRLIDDLLLYSRVGRNQDQVEQIAMTELAREVGLLFPEFASNQAELTILPLPAIWARPTQIRQLLQNLISNALKYNKSPMPRIEITGASQNGLASITVTDNGIGIESTDHQRIFDMFTRLHGASSSYVGSGIGLAICKKIVERHGGRMKVESTPGQGSTFSFTLPTP